MHSVESGSSCMLLNPTPEGTRITFKQRPGATGRTRSIETHTSSELHCSTGAGASKNAGRRKDRPLETEVERRTQLKRSAGGEGQTDLKMGMGRTTLCLVENASTGVQ